jgi:hypothetical protein
MKSARKPSLIEILIVCAAISLAIWVMLVMAIVKATGAVTPI